MLELKGIIPATALPMTDDAAIDEPALRHYVNWLLEQGVHGLAVNADTGEGPHLFPEERVRVIEVVRDEVRGRVPIIAGLAAAFTRQAEALARDAARAGADALLVFPIPAFRGSPLPAEVVVRYHRALARASGLPLVAFQLQEALGGVIFPPEVLEALLSLDEVVAVKEASFDAVRYVETLSAARRLPNRVSFLTGNDNFIHQSFVLGADGALIGFGTVAVEEQVRIYEAAERCDWREAERLWTRVRGLEEVIFAPPLRDYRVRLKEALVIQGVIPRATVREPLLPVDAVERCRIRQALVDAGLPVAPGASD